MHLIQPEYVCARSGGPANPVKLIKAEINHVPITPAILYFGTPVILITTSNPDGTPNIAPMSSVFWLGHRCIIGLATRSQNTINLLRTGECVLNLASDGQGDAINSLARTTGTEEVPPYKVAMGYTYVKNKFALTGLTPQPSEFVQPPRVKECRVQMEAVVAESTMLMKDDPDRVGTIMTFELKILKTYIDETLKLEGHANRVDSDKWNPMFMMFQELYGKNHKKVVSSNLAEINEENYRR